MLERNVTVPPEPEAEGTSGPASLRTCGSDSDTFAEVSRLDRFLLDLAHGLVLPDPLAATRPLDGLLQKVAHVLPIDRIILWEVSPAGSRTFQSHLWVEHAELGPPPELVDLPWLAGQCRRERIVNWSRVPDDLPAAAWAESEFARLTGVSSLLSIPVAADSMLYVLAFIAERTRVRWSRATVERLRLAAMILAGTLARSRTECSLRASEARYRAILQALPDLMLVLSPDGIYLECHRRDDSELLLAPESFIGRRVDDVLPGELAQLFRENLAAAAHSQGVVEAEYSMNIGGEQRHYELRMVQRDDGAILCLVRNISERNRAARRLRESEERFRGAFQHSAIGIAIVGLDGRWLQTNRANCRLLGYSEAELLASSFQALTHPDDLELNMKYLRRALDGEIDHYELEKRYFRKDGRIIWAFVTVSVVRDEQGQPLYFVSQLQDLTERKQAQAEIERLRIELTRVGRGMLMGQLTASLAHELLQPLTAIASNAEACQAWLARKRCDRVELRQALADISASCARGSAIIENVRELLRNRPAKREPVSLNRLAEQVQEVARPELLMRNVRALAHFAPALPEITGNSIELQQLMLNLLLNGAEAVESSAGTREVLIETSSRADAVEIAVHDSGRGVAPDMLDRIFEPFFTTKAGGMGMGLTICAEIVRRHGGTIWAELNARGGLTVRCALPRGLGPSSR
jgi:PAS domain S-box-containing protein